VWGLLQHTFYHEQQAKYVSTYLKDSLKPEIMIGTSGQAVLNEIQWFILVTFKSNIPSNEVHELGVLATYPVSVLRTIYMHHE